MISGIANVTVFSVLLMVFCIPVLSQNQRENNGGILIQSGKAPVYIEYVRLGICKKDTSNFNFGDLCDSKREDARAFDAVWLRLHNNTRWPIGLTVEKGATGANSSAVTIDSTTFVDTDGETKVIGKMVAKDDAEMDVVYKAESETGCDFSKPTPTGQLCFRRETSVPAIPLPGISSDVFVAPGKSIIFPVDRAHVKEYVNLFVIYNFWWEYSGRFFSATPRYQSQHRVYFGWHAIEKAIQSELDKKRTASLRNVSDFDSDGRKLDKLWSAATTL